MRSMDLPLLFRSSIPRIVIATYMASDLSTYRTYNLDIFSIPVRDLLRELLSLLLFRFGTLLQDTGRLSQDGSISNLPRYTGLCTGNKLCKVAMCCNHHKPVTFRPSEVQHCQPLSKTGMDTMDYRYL